MDISNLNEMKRQFDERLSELMSLKGQNTQFFTYESYTEMIEKVKSAKLKKSHKKPEDYQRLRRYDVLAVGETEKLIVPVIDNTIRFYVKNDEIFQILHDTHLSLGHAGRNRMEKEISFRFKNITREMIAIYLTLCESCENKHSIPKKGLFVKPILSGELNARCQVDLIDMQSQEDNQYKFILVYQDHITKFVQLRPLKSKTAEEVAYVLLDIFTIFGAPNILQSDNGREFSHIIVQEVCKMWPELKIVHGKPIYSHSQGSVQRSNQDIENMLSTWLDDNNTKKWSEGLRFVQLMKNRAHHIGINCTPYETMFGKKLRLGLKSSSIPHDALLDIKSEEDLEKLLSTLSTTTERNLVDFTKDAPVESAKNDQVDFIKNEQVEFVKNDQVEFVKNEPVEFVKIEQVEFDKNEQVELVKNEQAEFFKNEQVEFVKNEQVEFVKNEQVESDDNNQLEPMETDRVESSHNYINLSAASSSQFSLTLKVENESEKTSDTDSNLIFTNKNENLELKNNNIMAIRKLASSNLQKQANEMLDVSNAKYPMAAIGDTVRVRVPDDVDCAHSVGRNIIATVIEVTASNLYRLGTKHGVLSQLYSRNQVKACKKKIISPEDVPEVEISLREYCRRVF